VYPPARATHDQVCADPELFHETLRELYDDLDIKVAKVMKLGGQELNLHLLYQRVRALAQRPRTSVKATLLVSK
jgi:nitrate/nitrite-specific signal transduction histidine kinase